MRVQCRIDQARVPVPVPRRHILGPITRQDQREQEKHGKRDAPPADASGHRLVVRNARVRDRGVHRVPPNPQADKDQGYAKRRHQNVQDLAGGEPQEGRGVLAKHVDEDAKERIQEEKRAGQDAGRQVSLAQIQQDRDEEQVLQAVIQDDRMPKPIGVREFDRPSDGGHAADDLPVDKIADPPHAEDDGRRDREGIGNGQDGFDVEPAESPHAEQSPDQQAMRRHPAEPKRRYQASMLPVEGPLIEHHFHDAAAKQDATRQQETQRVHRAQGEAQLTPPATDKQINIQEPQGIAQAIPPEVNAAK